jgi:hypothetical protein
MYTANDGQFPNGVYVPDVLWIYKERLKTNPRYQLGDTVYLVPYQIEHFVLSSALVIGCIVASADDRGNQDYYYNVIYSPENGHKLKDELVNVIDQEIPENKLFSSIEDFQEYCFIRQNIYEIPGEVQQIGIQNVNHVTRNSLKELASHWLAGYNATVAKLGAINDQQRWLNDNIQTIHSAEVCKQFIRNCEQLEG